MSKHTPNTQLQYHILFEDLAAGLIGPFKNLTEVKEHIEFCEARGDGAAVIAIVPDKKGHQAPAGPYYRSLLEELIEKHRPLIRTPQQDRETSVPSTRHIW